MHRKLADRIEMAKLLQESGLAGNLVVDSMEDLACIKYGALPERLCLLTESGKVHFMTGVGPIYYSLSKLESAIVDLCGRQ